MKIVISERKYVNKLKELASKLTGKTNVIGKTICDVLEFITNNYSNSGGSNVTVIRKSVTTIDNSNHIVDMIVTPTKTYDVISVYGKFNVNGLTNASIVSQNMVKIGTITVDEGVYEDYNGCLTCKYHYYDVNDNLVNDIGILKVGGTDIYLALSNPSIINNGINLTLEFYFKTKRKCQLLLKTGTQYL